MRAAWSVTGDPVGTDNSRHTHRQFPSQNPLIFKGILHPQVKDLWIARRGEALLTHVWLVLHRGASRAAVHSRVPMASRGDVSTGEGFLPAQHQNPPRSKRAPAIPAATARPTTRQPRPATPATRLQGPRPVIERVRGTLPT
jgi:hypothetical protein